MSCPMCQNQKLSLIYEVQDIPVFQNKVYSSIEAAKNAQTAKVSLMLCQHCGFVFNSEFDMNIMNYDTQYQNEQAHSTYFQDYLNDIINLFVKKDFHKNRIIEIGCGKGYFLEKLQKHGFDIVGFDPAYEGDNPHIIKDYFSDKYSHLNGEVIVLRHTLEHIESPLNFIHNIAKSVDYKGIIFIEVPSFEWILQKKAFWDIFYEHCNYFTFDSLGNLFNKSEQGYLFNHQYMYLLSDLNNLRTQAKPLKTNSDFELIKKLSELLNEHLKSYQKIVQRHQQLLVWGAAAKGSTFVNLMDPNQKHIAYVIDINPRKQDRYIGKTAHKIVSPEIVNRLEKGDIFIMNENYYEEIKSSVGSSNFNFYVLGTTE